MRSVESTRALVLRRVPYRESDLIVEFLSESAGKVAAVARGARQSRRRFSGSLEPFHTLRIGFENRPGRDLAELREAALATPRSGLTSCLECMDTAGRILGWIRRACPPNTPEPRVWQLAEELLDQLDQSTREWHPRTALAEAGLALLDALGWGLVFDRCVACERICAPERAAWMHAARGGLVCRRCGAGRVLLEASVRARLARAAAGHWRVLERSDAEAAIDLVEAALLVHAGVG